MKTTQLILASFFAGLVPAQAEDAKTAKNGTPDEASTAAETNPIAWFATREDTDEDKRQEDRARRRPPVEE